MKNETKLITILKWLGTFAVILGVFLAAIDIHPLSSFTLMTASALWFSVGISWKEYAIVTTNVCTFSSSVIGLLIYYVGENNMNYEELQNKVNKILTEAEVAMENEIETFNETNDEDLEVNTTDLGYKFTELKDYVEDYT